jgi:hypothetical protein
MIMVVEICLQAAMVGLNEEQASGVSRRAEEPRNYINSRAGKVIVTVCTLLS